MSKVFVAVSMFSTKISNMFLHHMVSEAWFPSPSEHPHNFAQQRPPRVSSSVPVGLRDLSHQRGSRSLVKVENKLL